MLNSKRSQKEARKQVTAPGISLRATLTAATKATFPPNLIQPLICLVVEYMCFDQTFVVGQRVDVCLPDIVFDDDWRMKGRLDMKHEEDEDEEDQDDQGDTISVGRWMSAKIESISASLVICASLERDDLWKDRFSYYDAMHREYIPLYSAPDLLAPFAMHRDSPKYWPFFYPEEIGCFEADTQVVMANGYFSTISSIKIGDDVATVDEVTGVIGDAKVVRVAAIPTRGDAMVRKMVHYAGMWITPGHPIYTYIEGQSGWRRADALAPTLPRHVSLVFGLELSRQHTMLVSGDRGIKLIAATVGKRLLL
jgi:hypothetical protein